jgi:hypothetical protein
MVAGRAAVAVMAAGGAAGAGYCLAVTGKLAIDTGWGPPGPPARPVQH